MLGLSLKEPQAASITAKRTTKSPASERAVMMIGGALVLLASIDAVELTSFNLCSVWLSNGEVASFDPRNKNWTREQIVERMFASDVRSDVLAISDALKKPFFVNPAAVLGFRRLERGASFLLRGRALDVLSDDPTTCQRVAALLFGEEAAAPFAPPKPVAITKPVPKKEFPVLDAEQRAHAERVAFDARIAKAREPITTSDPTKRNMAILNVIDDLDGTGFSFLSLESLISNDEWRPAAKAFGGTFCRLRKAATVLLADDNEVNLEAVSGLVADLQRQMIRFPNLHGVQQIRELWSVHLNRLSHLQPTDPSMRPAA